MESRPRLISPVFWASESVGDLTYRQRTLFVGLITNADDQGRQKHRPALIRARIFPYDDISLEDIEADLEAICRMAGIHIYADGDAKSYIQIVKWWKFQHPSYAKPSRYPAPDGWEDNYRDEHNSGRSGYVYLLGGIGTSWTKIGQTKNVPDRIKQLGIKLPFAIELIGTICTNDSLALERHLHDKFADKRVQGEWFTLTEQDIDEIHKRYLMVRGGW